MRTQRVSPSHKPFGREEQINQACAKNRAICNRLTDAQREDLLNRAMQRIYGRRVKARRAHRA